MTIPQLPTPILKLDPCELVLYRWWCDVRNAWVTDGVPHLVLRENGGIADILMFGQVVRIPISLLKRADNDCSYFANLV